MGQLIYKLRIVILGTSFSCNHSVKELQSQMFRCCGKSSILDFRSRLVDVFATSREHVYGGAVMMPTQINKLSKINIIFIPLTKSSLRLTTNKGYLNWNTCPPKKLRFVRVTRTAKCDCSFAWGNNGENFATIPMAKRTACCRNKGMNGMLFGKLRLFNRYLKSTIWPQNFYMPLLFIWIIYVVRIGTPPF